MHHKDVECRYSLVYVDISGMYIKLVFNFYMASIFDSVFLQYDWTQMILSMFFIMVQNDWQIQI